jgi:hypothetical protein
MRLARTAAPLPRKSGRQESNLRSPAPKAGGVADLPYGQMCCSTPAGLEPAASGLRVRRHRPFDHGGKRSSGGRARTCASRVTVARLTARPHRNESGGSRTRTCERVAPACALATRCLADSAMPPDGRGGSRTPKGLSPPVFETGYHADSSPSRVAPAGIEPATPRLRVGSSAS